MSPSPLLTRKHTECNPPKKTKQNTQIVPSEVSHRKINCFQFWCNDTSLPHVSWSHGAGAYVTADALENISHCCTVGQSSHYSCRKQDLLSVYTYNTCTCGPVHSFRYLNPDISKKDGVMLCHCAGGGAHTKEAKTDSKLKRILRQQGQSKPSDRHKVCEHNIKVFPLIA